MSPLEYLRQLQAGARASLGIPQARREQLVRQGHEEILAEIPESVEGQESKIQELLVSPLLASLPPTDAANLRDVYVGILPIYDPNAWALITPDGAPLVVFHSEMLGVLSYYAEFQFAFARTDQTDPALAMTILRQGYKIVVDSFAGRRNYDIPPLPVDLGDEDFLKVQLKVFANALFVLAHEFAHVTLQHVDSAATAKLEVGSHGVTRVEWNREQELAADALATTWLTQLEATSPYPMIRFAAIAPATCVEVLALVHVVELFLRPHAAEATAHPSALERLEAIMESNASRLDEVNRVELLSTIRQMRALRRGP